MNYEDKMRALANCRPEKKDILLLQLLQGHSIDLTKDEDLFYQINKDRVSMDQFVNRNKFKADAQAFKDVKEGLHDTRMGKTKGGNRHLGDIPAEIYYARKELSDPSVPREERIKNIKKFFNDYPAFRTGDSRI